jgi:hypothetical protein
LSFKKKAISIPNLYPIEAFTQAVKTPVLIDLGRIKKSSQKDSLKIPGLNFRLDGL